MNELTNKKMKVRYPERVDFFYSEQQEFDHGKITSRRFDYGYTR